MADIEKDSVQHVEETETVTPLDAEIVKVHTMGTVKLTEGKIVYIPTPTADPQGECC